MYKLILDTNVIVSALIQQNYPYYIVKDYVLADNAEICLSNDLFDEYKDVLARPKFARFTDFTANAGIVLIRLAKIATFYEPTIKLNIIKDLSDNKLLELAQKSKADFLITGNIADFTISHYENTRIISPRDFWEYINFQ